MADFNAQQKDLLTMFTELLQKAPETIGKVATTANNALPTNVLARLLGSVSSYVPGKEGSAKQTGKLMLDSLNPIQRNVLKTVQKVQKQQVEEAMQQGVTPEHILSQSGIDLSNNQQPQQASQSAGQSQGNSQLQGTEQPLEQQPSIQPQQQSQGPYIEKNLLVKLFDTLGFRESAQSQLAGSQTRLNLQELAGNKPLQEGEREKINLSFMQDIMKNNGGKSLSSDAVKNLENSKTGIEQTQLLLDQFSKDPDLFKGFGGPADPRSQQVKFIRKNLTDTIGRLRSGGAINAYEQKTFSSFVPGQGPIKGRLEAPETVVFKLQTLNKLFSGVVNGLMPVKEASGLVSKIQTSLDEGYSPSEISKFMGF